MQNKHQLECDPHGIHSPSAGCKAYVCGLSRPGDCPFTIDQSTDLLTTRTECEHEWRQLIFWQGVELSGPTFYCIHNPSHRLDD